MTVEALRKEALWNCIEESDIARDNQDWDAFGQCLSPTCFLVQNIFGQAVCKHGTEAIVNFLKSEHHQDDTILSVSQYYRSANNIRYIFSMWLKEQANIALFTASYIFTEEQKPRISLIEVKGQLAPSSIPPAFSPSPSTLEKLWNLQRSCAYALRTEDWGLYGNLFTQNAVWISPANTLKGRDAIVKWHADHSRTNNPHHITPNTILVTSEEENGQFKLSRTYVSPWPNPESLTKVTAIFEFFIGRHPKISKVAVTMEPLLQ